mmetsp:Transcript_47879/g.135268  ORF Transcript_47879/g.135268 Transcript_47879/m.135268 type:complete len:266 (+) Transcript_47879:700-1497(+)
MKLMRSWRKWTCARTTNDSMFVPRPRKMCLGQANTQKAGTLNSTMFSHQQQSKPTYSKRFPFLCSPLSMDTVWQSLHMATLEAARHTPSRDRRQPRVARRAARASSLGLSTSFSQRSMTCSRVAGTSASMSPWSRSTTRRSTTCSTRRTAATRAAPASGAPMRRTAMRSGPRRRTRPPRGASRSGTRPGCMRSCAALPGSATSPRPRPTTAPAGPTPSSSFSWRAAAAARRAVAAGPCARWKGCCPSWTSRARSAWSGPGPPASG